MCTGCLSAADDSYLTVIHCLYLRVEMPPLATLLTLLCNFAYWGMYSWFGSILENEGTKITVPDPRLSRPQQELLDIQIYRQLAEIF